MSILSVIKSIQDIMRQDVGVDGDAQRIAQLVWMIFLKIFADKEAELELLEDEYRSPLPEHLRWENWASNEEGMTGDELLDFVNNKLFPALKELPDVQEGTRGYIIREVFRDSYNYMKSGTLMRQIINKINRIDFNSSDDRHLFNDFYESFLKGLQSAGNAGEFYTPRAVTQFMVDIVDPKLGEKIIDPACGTGGFLKSTIEHLMGQAKTAEDRKIAQNSIFGIEKKPLPHVLATTNLILHDVDIPNIRHDNSLSRPIRDYGNKDKVDIVITNPPFGGVEEEGIQANFPASFRTKETADLFMVLILTLFKDFGRGAVVLPDGFLFGEGVKTRIKEKLLEECNLHTIVRLPKNVFAPYTDIATNLLFFEKGKPTTEVWYYEHQKPQGTKHYSKTKPIRYEEFQAELDWWNNRVENAFAWKVSIETIKERNYNLDISNPNRKPEGLKSSDEITNVMLDIQSDIGNYLMKVNENLLNFDTTAFPLVKLSSFLRKSNEQTVLDANAKYTQVTVKLWGKGVIKRNEVLGNQIASEKRNVVRMNQLIFSKIDAKSGAIGIVPDSLDGAVVSSDFPVFNVDQDMIIPDFLNLLVKTPSFLTACQKLSSGTTNRVRLKEKDFLEIQVPLPDIESQKAIVQRVQSVLSICDKIEVEIKKLEEYSGMIKDSILNEVIDVGRPYK